MTSCACVCVKKTCHEALTSLKSLLLNSRGRGWKQKCTDTSILPACFGRSPHKHLGKHAHTEKPLSESSPSAGLSVFIFRVAMSARLWSMRFVYMCVHEGVWGVETDIMCTGKWWSNQDLVLMVMVWSDSLSYRFDSGRWQPWFKT